MENLTRRCKERCLGTSLEYCMGWAKETRFFLGGRGTLMRWSCPQDQVIYIYMTRHISIYIYTCILYRYILYLYVYICIYICAYIGFFNPKLINGVAWSPLGWNDSEWFLMWMMMCQFFSLCPTVPHRIMSFCRKWPFLVKEKNYIVFGGTCFPLNQVGVIVSQAVGTSRLDSHVSTIQQQTHPSHWIKQTSRDLHRFRGFPKPSPTSTDHQRPWFEKLWLELDGAFASQNGHLLWSFFVWEQTRRQ